MIPKRTIEHIKEDPSTAKTQLVIVTGLLVLAAIFQTETVAYIALLIGLICLVIPPAGNWLVWGWYKLAEVLGFINARIILTLLYYFFITPIAFFFRLAGNDPLQLKKPDRSTFVFRNHTFEKKDLENPW